MKRVKISVVVLLSLLTVAPSIVSCSSNDDTAATSASTKNSPLTARSTSNTAWYTYMEANSATIARTLETGFTQADVDNIAVGLGYSRDYMSLDQFNRIYAELTSHLDDTSYDLEDVYDRYYSDRSDFFKGCYMDIVSRTTIDAKIGTKEWTSLTPEDQNFLAGLNDMIRNYPSGFTQSSTARAANQTNVSIPISDELGVVLFYGMVGYAIGGPIGGAIGVVVGFIAISLK